MKGGWDSDGGKPGRSGGRRPELAHPAAAAGHAARHLGRASPLASEQDGLAVPGYLLTSVDVFPVFMTGLH